MNDRTVLQCKLVVTLEPTICYSGGGDIPASIDQFLIAEDGAEWHPALASIDLYVQAGTGDRNESPKYALIRR